MHKRLLQFGYMFAHWMRKTAGTCSRLGEIRYGTSCGAVTRANQNSRTKIGCAICVLALSGVLCSWSAAGESLHDQIQRANGQLRSGEPEKALDSYHGIQVDHPDARVLDYNIGCAEYEKNIKEQNAAQGKDKQAKPSFGDAIESFDRAMQSDNPVVSKSAEFNRANCLAKTAELAEATGPDRAKAFEKAIGAYQSVLDTDPSNMGAKQNIDYLRYLLKKGTPPPPSQQQKGDQSKQDQSGADQNQQQDKNDESSEQEPSEQNASRQQNPPQQDRNPQSQPDRQQNDNQQSGSDQNQPQNSSQSEQNASEEKQDAGSPPPDRRSVEALLQSLENQDKEMQKNLRKSATAMRVRPSGWW